jgi:hypothetical protein
MEAIERSTSSDAFDGSIYQDICGAVINGLTRIKFSLK